MGVGTELRTCILPAVWTTPGPREILSDALMTTRHHRKSGSGPSALALIAWVKSTEGGSDRLASNVWSGVPHLAAQSADSRTLLVGRARGFAAATLLACGSVLAVAGHAADSSSRPLQSLHPGLVTTGPGEVSGGYAARRLAVAVLSTPVFSTAGLATAGPAATSAQVFAATVPRPVHRNPPLAVGEAGEPPSKAYLPVPLALPDAAGPGQSSPIEDEAAPAEEVLARLEHLVTPVAEGTQPAMTMPPPLRHSWRSGSISTA